MLDRLNERQREAVCHGQDLANPALPCGPLVVVAGAGTGKTATLAHRVAWLVHAGVRPERVLLLTFSRRAAREVTGRAERLLGRGRRDDPSMAGADPRSTEQSSAPTRSNGADEPLGVDPALWLPWAGTFHAVAARMLRRGASVLGLAPSFGILDRSDSAELMEVVRQDLGLVRRTARRFPRKETCLALHSLQINTGAPLPELVAQHHPWCQGFEPLLEELFVAYAARKRLNAVLDYDDLLMVWAQALEEPGFLRTAGVAFDHILVDEFQDTNRLQGRILDRLSPQGLGLGVVGDDAQSIYGFRAADPDLMLGFAERYQPPATRVTLELNYRSVQPVLDLAAALMDEAAQGYRKHLKATRPHGLRPLLVTVADEQAQVDWVADQVLERREAGIALADQAVLYRSAHHADLLELGLTQRGIPYVKQGGLRFLDTAHVRDVLAVLRWAENPRDRLAGFRALQVVPGVGPAQAARTLAAVVDGGRSLSDLPVPRASSDAWVGWVTLMTELRDPATVWAGQFERLLHWYRPVLAHRHDNAPVRLADLEMLAALARRSGSRERFLTTLALDPPEASGDLAASPRRDEAGLILSTVHSAKGQEWEAVYVISLSDGNFPNEYAVDRPALLEEERRLLYVAITRARTHLQLIEPLAYFVTGQARLGDRRVHGARSRFLTPAVLARLEPVSPAG